MSDETTDVSNNKHLAFCVKYINTENGDACIDYLKDVKITDGKAETIFKETEKVVEELGLSNFVGYASDGCQTMIGKKTGVATRLKAIKPGLVTVHCHNHRLALAAKDSFESITLMRDTDDLLNHVFKYYHYSANKTASLQKIQTMLEEKGKTIKQAGHTRWLSHKAAVTSLRDCYKAVLIDLENAEASGADKVRMGSGPRASGLLKKLKNPATAKIVHFLCDALRPLTALTLVFERNDINLSVIKPRKDSTISGLKNLKETYGSSERKCDKLLADLGLEATEQQLKSVHNARTMFLDKLVDNINVRLASSDVIDQLAVFNMDETETFYGNDEIACLADNFGLDADEVTEEWDDFKNAISSTSPEVIRGPHRLIKAMMKIRPHKFPNIERLCATAVVVPVSTAEVERVFSELARTKTDLRNRLQIPGCYGSSLFQAFSAHLVHRLHIAQDGPLQGKIRITLLDRDTKFRGIMNQNELFSALKSVGEYEVNVVKYKYRYHTDDPNCYLDLARLRGVKYFTWEKMDKLTQEDEVLFKIIVSWLLKLLCRYYSIVSWLSKLLCRYYSIVSWLSKLLCRYYSIVSWLLELLCRYYSIVSWLLKLLCRYYSIVSWLLELLCRYYSIVSWLLKLLCRYYSIVSWLLKLLCRYYSIVSWLSKLLCRYYSIVSWLSKLLCRYYSIVSWLSELLC
ncbi:EOGT-like protein, partial [Mya arenaria]